MRVLISGAAGFLGSHLTDLLLSQGHEIVGVDNFITGKPENIAHLRGNRRYTFIKADVIQPLKIEGSLDRIYHMASPASPIGYVKHQVATLKVNSQGTWNLLEMAEAKGAISHGKHERMLRRSGRPSAARGLLGKRKPHWPAKHVR